AEAERDPPLGCQQLPAPAKPEPAAFERHRGEFEREEPGPRERADGGGDNGADYRNQSERKEPERDEHGEGDDAERLGDAAQQRRPDLLLPLDNPAERVVDRARDLLEEWLADGERYDGERVGQQESGEAEHGDANRDAQRQPPALA